jgi:hypothetical protein
LGDLEPNHLEELNTYSERLTRRKTTIREEDSSVVLNAWAAADTGALEVDTEPEKDIETRR